MSALRLCSLAMLMLVSALSMAEPARVQQPRPYGYVIGDMLEQRIALQSGGAAFVPATLPRAEPVGVSLWRRAVERETDAAGIEWLVLRYQVVNTPSALAVWELPALELASADPKVSLSVPVWAFSVSPFTRAQAFGKGELTALRVDRNAPVVPLAPLDRRLKIAGAALCFALLLWAAYGWWHYQRSGRHLPFARAVRDLRNLPENSPMAWRRVQHALNDAAGHVVRADTLDALLARAPWLAQERAMLERFCRDSRALFFGRGLPVDATPAHVMAARLRKIERRHAP